MALIIHGNGKTIFLKDASQEEVETPWSGGHAIVSVICGNAKSCTR